MEHLVMHLPFHALMCGPAQYWWMYPFERFLHDLKYMVKNRTRVEGSTCEAYLTQETSYFSSYYFDSNIQSKSSRKRRNETYFTDAEQTYTLSVFSPSGRPSDKCTTRWLRDIEMKSASLIVLSQCEEAIPFIELYKSSLRHQFLQLDEMVVQQSYEEHFVWWFQKMGNRKGKAATRKKKSQNKVEGIGQLPDSLLVSIISLLTVQEAVATSILSTHWRHLYTHINRLDFKPLRPPKRIIALKPPEQRKFHGSKPRKLDSIGVIKTPQELRDEFSKRPFWISQFLDSYTNAASHVLLKEIRLKIMMNFDERVDIEKWLEFVMSTQVEILSIHLDDYSTYEDSHKFPVENLTMKISNCCTCFTTLKTLDLCNVDLHVTELFLSNCDVLESLSIKRCKNPGNLIITCPKLKYLYINACVASVKVRGAINLVSFTYESQEDLMVMENVPMLTQIDTDVSLNNTHVELLPTLSCCINQLVKLSLRIKPYEMQRYGIRHALPKLINLKHLVLRMDMSNGLCILPLTPLIEASPSLQKLEMEFFWVLNTPIFSNVPTVNRYIWEHFHYNLKSVKFSGYLGSPEELEFASYIFKNAVKLEEFEVKLCRSTRSTSAKLEEFDVKSIFGSTRPTNLKIVGRRIICTKSVEIVKYRDVPRKASALAQQKLQAITPQSVNLVIHY